MEYIVENKGITEFDGLIRFGLRPSKLRKIVNSLQRDGLTISFDNNWGDNSYYLVEFFS